MTQTFKQFLIEGVATREGIVDISLGTKPGHSSAYRLPISALADLYKLDDIDEVRQYVHNNGKYMASLDDADVFLSLKAQDIEDFRSQLKDLTEGEDWRGIPILPKGSTVTVVKKGSNFDGKTGKVISVNTADRGMPKGKLLVNYGVKIGGETNFFNGTQLKGAQSFTQKEPDRKHFKEGAQTKARWKKTKGPEGVPGFELDIPSESGGWKTLGFKMATTMPTTEGKIKLYHGATGKDVWYDLSHYTFDE